MLDRPTLPKTLSWSEDEDRLIRIGRQQSLTTSQIAQSLPGRTRNAILGRANRLGLCADNAIARQRRAAEAKARGVEKRARRPRMFPAKPKPVKVVPMPVDAPESLQLLCEELKPNSCRYIAGDPKDGGTYCGHQITRKSLCAYHYRICWVRPEGVRA